MKLKNGCVLMFCIALFIGCKQESEKKVDTVQPIKVKVVKMSPTEIGNTQGYSGTVEETNGSILSFSAIGTVKKVAVSVGQRVSHGQLLAILDDVSIKNQYNAALSMREQAEDAHKRMKLLHDNGSLPEIQWVDVESKLKQAIAAEQIAKKSLNDSKLYAPFSGVISEKNIEEGQNVLPGMQAFKLITIDKVNVKISIPEKEISHIKIGQKARISVASLGDNIFEGKVTEKGVVANSLSRSYEVKILIDNDGKLMPGMICDVHLQKEDAKSAFMLPTPVIQIDDMNQQFVWVNKDGKVTKRNIKTGTLTAMGVVIEEGLNDGDEVLIEGQQKVSENTAITIEQ